MLILRRIFPFPVSSSIAQRDEKVLRICCSSPKHIKNAPGDYWKESTSTLEAISSIAKPLEPGKSGKINFDICKKATTSKNPPEDSSDPEDLKITEKTYPGIIKEYSDQIASKIELRNKEKNRSSRIFSKTTIDRISSLAGLKKNKNGGDNSSSNNSSSSNPQNPPGDSSKKFKKYSKEETPEISVIIEPLTTNLHKNMSDTGIMMITVREKISSTGLFQSVDLRINSEPITRVNQITTKFPNLNVTSSSDKYEIKIPISIKNKSILNLLVSGIKDFERETTASLGRMTGYFPDDSLMSKVVPWWTTLESFRAPETSGQVADVTKDSSKTYEMIKILHDNNSGNSVGKPEVKVNLNVKPVKSSSIRQMDHDKGVNSNAILLQKSDRKIFNLTNPPKQSFDSKNRISPSHRFPVTRLRYAPVIKLSVFSMRLPWTNPKSPSPPSVPKNQEAKDPKFRKSSLPSKLSLNSEEILEPVNVELLSETKRPIKKEKSSNLIDYGHRLPALKKLERKLQQLEYSKKDEGNRMQKEVSPKEGVIPPAIAKVIAKKSAARDAPLQRIIKTVKKQNEGEPASKLDGQGQKTKGDDSVKAILQDDRLKRYRRSDNRKEYFDELFSVKSSTTVALKTKVKMESSESHDKLFSSKTPKPIQSATIRLQNPEKGSNSSDSNSQVTLQGTKTSGESGSSTYPEVCTSTLCLKDENILSTPGTRSMRKFKMRLQRSMDRDMMRNADTSVEEKCRIKEWNHVNLNHNAAKKLLYSAWLNSRDDESQEVTGIHEKLDD